MKNKRVIKKNSIAGFASAIGIPFAAAAIAQIFSIAHVARAATTISANIPGSYSNSVCPGAFIDNFYQFALIAGGILAFGVVVYGGIRYMTSAGNPSGQSDAKEWITAALLGLLLLGGAYYILKIVNPGLVNLTLPSLGSGDLGGCVSGAGPNISVTSTPAPRPSPSPGARCQAPASGPCTVAALQGTCMGNNAAAAAGVCNVESSGNAAAKSGTDKCDDGSPVSFGLFQINITANTLPGPNGTLNCPKAFSNAFTGHNPHCTILDKNLYNQCAAAAQNAAVNIAKACQLSGNGTNWSQWGPATKKACGV